MKKPTATIMYPSSTTSSQRCHQLPWLHTFLLIFLSTVFFQLTSVSCSATQNSYTEHCATVVPESTPTSLVSNTSPFSQFKDAYYIGGDRILNRNSSHSSPQFLRSIWFNTHKMYKTNIEGVFKVEGSVELRIPNRYRVVQNNTYGRSNYPQGRPIVFWISTLIFRLEGFWSESSGKLCMVGSCATYSKEGELLDLGAVLKLNYVKNSSIFNSLVSGTLESLSSPNDSNYFEQISMLAFNKMNYNYNYPSVLEEFGHGCSGESGIPHSLPISSQQRESLCYRRAKVFYLKYGSDCDYAKNCSPFGENIGYLPRVMYFTAIQCSEENQKMQVRLQFLKNGDVIYYEPPFSPNTTLIGEGWWDGKKNQLHVVACRILDTTDSLAHAHVGDCSIRLSLRFSAILSIRHRGIVVGQIWSTKTVEDSGYFKQIMYQDSGYPTAGLKYEYTEMERVGKSCPGPKKSVEGNGAKYPNGNSSDLRFSMWVKNSEGRRVAWGFSDPLTVGSLFCKPSWKTKSLSSSRPAANSIVEANTKDETPLNVSYQISLLLLPDARVGGGSSPFNKSSSSDMREEISAEGIYDAKTGGLCMVGCRSLDKDSMDCEILVNFQFPPANSMGNGGYIKGSMESTRDKSDPLYFGRLDLSSTASSVLEALKLRGIEKDFHLHFRE